MKFASFFRKASLLGGAVVLSSGITYYLTSTGFEQQVEDLQTQVKELESKELQARVMRRVSDQLEDIASQQTFIARDERDKAEEAKARALQAQKEAQQAQKEALAAADEARRQKLIADRQTAIAMQKMEEAQLERDRANNEKNRADTLLYRSLANSLAQYSLMQEQAKDYELAGLLSYAAWHYSNIYQGKDEYNRSNIYKALLYSSGLFVEAEKTGLRGNVRRMRTIGHYTLGVTDYGEVYYSDGTHENVVRLGNHDMRDFLSDGLENNYILCAGGYILHSDIRGIENGAREGDLKTKSIFLCKDVWHSILGSEKLMYAMGDKTIAWVEDGKVVTKSLPDQLSAIGLQGDRLHIFGRDGKHYVSDEPGKVTEVPPSGTMEGNYVTAYKYDDEKGYQLLGMYDGRITVLDKDGNHVTDLFGHTAPVTDIHVAGNIIGSTSYDYTMKLWDINGIGLLLTPVELEFNEWPLCFSVDRADNTFWVGMENGFVSHFCSDSERNAVSTKNNLKRDFSDKEWNFYVGRGIKREHFYREK